MSVETVAVSATSTATSPPNPSTKIQRPAGKRKNGKSWHPIKSAFRPTAGLTSYARRKELDQARKMTREREAEMKAEKEEERNRRIQAIKDRRKAREEKERFEKMQEKVHRKIVERRRRREKRNKLLKSGK